MEKHDDVLWLGDDQWECHCGQFPFEFDDAHRSGRWIGPHEDHLVDEIVLALNACGYISDRYV